MEKRKSRRTDVTDSLSVNGSPSVAVHEENILQQASTAAAACGELFREAGDALTDQRKQELQKLSESTELLSIEGEASGLEVLDLTNYKGRLQSFSCRWKGAVTGALTVLRKEIASL